MAVVLLPLTLSHTCLTGVVPLLPPQSAPLSQELKGRLMIALSTNSRAVASTERDATFNFSARAQVGHTVV